MLDGTILANEACINQDEWVPPHHSIDILPILVPSDSRPVMQIQLLPV